MKVYYVCKSSKQLKFYKLASLLIHKNKFVSKNTSENSKLIQF